MEEINNKKISRGRKVCGIIFFIIFILSTLLQVGYVVILKRHNFEYITDYLPYLVNETIILSLYISIFLLNNKKEKAIRIVISTLAVIVTIANVVLMINNISHNKCVVEHSNDFSNTLVLKYNAETGKATIYKNVIGIFARPKEQFTNTIVGKIKTQWLTNDACSITYKNSKDDICEYVYTCGDRGDGISYYYVASAIQGDWKMNVQNEDGKSIKANSKGITINDGKKESIFAYDDCKQFGTISVVLYKNNTPKWIITLNQDCTLDKKTDLVKEGGTISLCEVSMDKTANLDFVCTTPKN